MTSLARAHLSPPPMSDGLGAAWNLEPSLLLALALTACVYALGVRNVWRRARAGHGIPLWRCASFVAALLALIAALLSPLDELSAELFSAHMLQHLILMFVAAPCLVLSE